MIGRFLTETSALMMVFSILDHERVKWRKVRMRPAVVSWIEEAAEALDQEPIRLEFAERVSVA